MSRIYRVIGIIALSCGVMVASTFPAEATINPGVIASAIEAGGIVTEAASTVAIATGLGEVVAMAYGAYLTYSAVSSWFHIKSPVSAATPASPFLGGVVEGATRTTCGIVGLSGYRTYGVTGTTCPGENYYSWSDGNSFNTAAHNFTAVGGATIAGSQLNYTTGSIPKFVLSSSNYPYVQCGVFWKSVSTGAVSYSFDLHNGSVDYLDGMTTIRDPQPSQTNKQVSNCTAGIQTSITYAGIDQTTKIYLGQAFLLRPYSDVDGTFHTVAMGTFPNQSFSVNASDIIAETLDPAYNTGASYTVAVSCTTVSGGSVTVNTQAPVPYTANTDQAVEVKPCPSGSYKSKVVVTRSQGGLASSTVTTWSQITPSSTPYPLCGGANACALLVYYNSGGTQTACDTTVLDCQNWFTLVKSDPTSFTCHWGSYTLPTMASCQFLQYQYQPGAIRGLDGVATLPQTAPVTSLGTGTGSSPSNDTSTPTLTDPSAWGCAPSGWGLLNPLAYVGSTWCLIKLAVFPSAGVFTNAATQLKTAWTGSSVGTFTTAVISVPSTLLGLAGNGATDCQGPGFTLTVGTVTPRMVYPLNACASPMSGVASTTRLLGSIFVGFGGVVLIWNTYASALGLPKISFKPQVWEQGELF